MLTIKVKGWYFVVISSDPFSAQRCFNVHTMLFGCYGGSFDVVVVSSDGRVSYRNKRTLYSSSRGRLIWSKTKSLYLI